MPSHGEKTAFVFHQFCSVNEVIIKYLSKWHDKNFDNFLTGLNLIGTWSQFELFHPGCHVNKNSNNSSIKYLELQAF